MADEDPRNDWRKLKAAHDVHFVDGPELLVDEWHYYMFRSARHVFLDDDDLYSFYSIHGRNVSDMPTEWCPLTVAGDSQCDVEDMDIEVHDRRLGGSWRLGRRDLLHDTPYVKTLRIEFARLLPVGDEFKFDVHLRWPGTSTTDDDYVFASLRMYPRGVDTVSLAAAFSRPPRHCLCGYLASDGSFQLLDEGVLKLDDERCEARWTISRPRLDTVYVLRFRRTDRELSPANPHEPRHLRPWDAE